MGPKRRRRRRGLRPPPPQSAEDKLTRVLDWAVVEMLSSCSSTSYLAPENKDANPAKKESVVVNREEEEGRRVV